MVHDDAPRRRFRSQLSAIVPAALFATCVVMATTDAASASTSPPPTPPNSSTTDATRSGADKATFGIGPANLKGIDGRAFLNYLVEPGSRFTDHAAIVNLAYQPVTLSLYPADAVVSADGQFGYQPRAADRVDASKWISADTPGHSATVTLGPRATVVVPLSIAVPSDASPGDHAAGVITSVTSQVTSKNGERVNFEQRIALRTFFRVSGALHPALAIENLRVRYHDSFNPFSGGAVTIDYVVRNTGNVRLGSHQKVAVSGFLGSTGPSNALADVPLLLPKTFVNESVTVRGVVPQLSMHARVSLYPLTIAGDIDPGVPAKFTAVKAFWAIPWGLIVILVTLVFVAVAWWYLRNRGWRPPASHQYARPGRKPTGPPGPNGKIPSSARSVPART